jgi:hypothetical protein
MVSRRWIVAVATMFSASRAAAAEPYLRAHPLHTTLTEVAVNPSTHTVRAVVRVFADDIAAALAKRAGDAPVLPSDAGATAYVLSKLTVHDRSSRALALAPCGVKRSGDLLWVCVETGPIDLEAVRIRNLTLCELFSDQVNIVQVAGAGTQRSILFTRGDGPKSLL